MPAAAHPHVFIDYTTAILCAGDAIVGVRVTWIFDEMYSAGLYHDYTSRPVGPLSPHDVAQLHDGAFQDTAKYHYFLDLLSNDKTVAAKEAKDFDASFDGRKMIYRFTVPVHVIAAGGQNAFDIAAFDNEYYIDFELAKHDAIKIEHGEKLGLACAPKKERRPTNFLGPVETTIVHCTFANPA